MVTKQAAAAVALLGWALWSTQGAVGQEPIDGVCDESVRNGCAAGTPNDESFDDIDTGYLWRCDGQYGGANSDKCFRRVPVDGVCDENVRNGCATGIPNDEAFDDIDTGYLWRCDGQYGGTNSDSSQAAACGDPGRSGVPGMPTVRLAAAARSSEAG